MVNTKIKSIICFCLFIMLIPLAGFASDKGKKEWFKKRVSFYPVISFVSATPEYTSNVRSSFGLALSYKFEYLNKRGFNYMFGMDYLTQGVSFNSYYFSSGYSVIYDKDFQFEHSLRMHEVQFPVLLKQSIGKEDNAQGTYYFTLGWALRLILYSRTSIENGADGSTVYSGSTPVRTEDYMLTPYGGGLLQAGAGWQRNYIGSGNAWFVEFVFKYGLSRFNYKGNNSNDIYIKESGLWFGVGIRF